MPQAPTLEYEKFKPLKPIILKREREREKKLKPTSRGPFQTVKNQLPKPN